MEAIDESSEPASSSQKSTYLESSRPLFDASQVQDDCNDVQQIDFEPNEAACVHNREFLEQGGALLSFACTKTLSPKQQEIVSAVANLSCFEDEVRDNSVPKYVPGQENDKYTYLLVATEYLLPFPFFIDWITPERLASTSYQAHCQVPSTLLSKQTQDHTFRFTKPIIPPIVNMTVQFRVSELPRSTLNGLSRTIGGIFIDKGLLLERTKQNKHSKPDRCRKAKSVLLYTRVDGGVLCHHLTVIFQYSIPKALASILNHYGGMGAKETRETVINTRRFIRTLDLSVNSR
jgi:hypothetical protein